MNDKPYINFLVAGLSIFILSVFTASAAAQGLDGVKWLGWGVRGGLSADPDQVYGGAHANLGEFAKDVRFRPSIELGFGDDQTVVQTLAEVHYVFSNIQTWQPYVGGGLGLTYVNFDDNQNRNDDSDTDLSLCPIAGIETNIDENRKFFFEMKLGLTGNDPDIKFGVGVSWK